MRTSHQLRVIVLLMLAIAIARPALAQRTTTSGEFVTEPPTLVSLGFEWRIAGDDNRNAKVDVSFRKKSEPSWHPALPLLRVHNEQIGVPPAPAGGRGGGPGGGGDGAGARYPAFKYTAANMFSGSILNLEADTEYECRFTLSDPDGVTGPKEKIVTVRTRKEPQPAEGGHVYHVYPVGWDGPKEEPAFTGLMAAYYMASAHYDYENAYPPRVQPGDVILVHAGVYVGDRFHYMNGPPRPGYLAMGNLFDGTYYLTASGTPDKPIVIKGAGDGEAIFDGDGCQTFFNLMGGSYNYFEGITIRNANVAFLLGIKNIAGSSGFTLKHSRLYDVGRAVQDDWSGSKNVYIADNVFIGRHDPNKMMSWTGAPWSKFPDYPELLLSEYAVKVYGQGHVVAYNYIANWHDGVDVATYGTPDGAPNDIPDRVPLAIDFYNNDFYNMGDNCVETDGERAQHPRVQESLLQLCIRRLERPARVWRPGLLLPEPGLQRAGQRRIEVHRGIGGRLHLQQHVHLRRARRAGIKRALPEQPDPVGGQPRRRVRDHGNVHQLHELGLQRLPSGPGRRSRLRVELPAVRRPHGLQERAGCPPLQDARRVLAGHRAGQAQCPRRL